MIIAGDSNIDLCSSSNIGEKYQAVLHAFNLTQHVTAPTRKGKCLIDHIITNIPQNVIATDVLATPEISDHDMPYLIVNARLNRFEPRFKYIRSERLFSPEAFLQDISELPFSTVYAVDDIDEKIDIFNELLRSCIDRHAPLVRCKLTRPPAPWLQDVDIQNLQKRLDALRFIAHQTQLESDWSIYRSVRNKIKSAIKTAKHNFYRKALSSKRSKNVWSVIHKILNPNPKRIRSDPAELNNFFVSTTQRIFGVDSGPGSDIVTYLKSLPQDRSDNGFKLKPVTFNDVCQQLNIIRNDCSTGYDHLPIKYLKLASQHILSPLTHIVNALIAENRFPSSWKVARISPIPKNNNPVNNSDFRPVSVLPILSKIYERLVLSQLVQCIDQNTLYKETVSGFRKEHSTAVILLKLKDDIPKAMKKGEITLAVFTDYSKAFDTVDFRILLKKLYDLGFPTDLLLWIHSYLDGRKQFVMRLMIVNLDCYRYHLVFPRDRYWAQFFLTCTWLTYRMANLIVITYSMPMILPYISTPRLKI